MVKGKADQTRDHQRDHKSCVITDIPHLTLSRVGEREPEGTARGLKLPLPCRGD